MECNSHTLFSSCYQCSVLTIWRTEQTKIWNEVLETSKNFIDDTFTFLDISKTQMQKIIIIHSKCLK